jgi:hypothetical protein
MLDTGEQFVNYVGWSDVVASVTTLLAVSLSCDWPEYLRIPYVSEGLSPHINSVSIETILFILKMEAVCYSEALVHVTTTRCRSTKEDCYQTSHLTKP